MLQRHTKFFCNVFVRWDDAGSRGCGDTGMEGDEGQVHQFLGRMLDQSLSLQGYSP